MHSFNVLKKNITNVIDETQNDLWDARAWQFLLKIQISINEDCKLQKTQVAGAL